MKNSRLFFAAILISFLFLLGFNMFNNFKTSRNLKIEKKNKLKKSAEVLNHCFDLKNKSQRTLNDSMKLIEYCLEKYGSKK